MFPFRMRLPSSATSERSSTSFGNQASPTACPTCTRLTRPSSWVSGDLICVYKIFNHKGTRRNTKEHEGKNKGTNGAVAVVFETLLPELAHCTDGAMTAVQRERTTAKGKTVSV